MESTFANVDLLARSRLRLQPPASAPDRQPDNTPYLKDVRPAGWKQPSPAATVAQRKVDRLLQEMLDEERKVKNKKNQPASQHDAVRVKRRFHQLRSEEQTQYAESRELFDLLDEWKDDLQEVAIKYGTLSNPAAEPLHGEQAPPPSPNRLLQPLGGSPGKSSDGDGALPESPLVGQVTRVHVPGVGMPGQYVEFVDSVPKHSLVTLGGKRHAASRSPSGKRVGDDKFRGGLYKSASNLVLPPASTPKHPVVSPPRKNRLPSPEHVRQFDRAGPDFLLVDRLAEPMRMPPALQAFWSRHEAEAPDWADGLQEETRRSPTPSMRRRLAALKSGNSLDFSGVLPEAKALTKPHKQPEIDSFDAGSVMHIELPAQYSDNVQAFLAQQLGGGLWDDQAASTVAAPMSAAHLFGSPDYCLQVNGAATAPRFQPLIAASGAIGAAQPFPYSMDAHDATSRIQRAYRRHWMRRVQAATMIQSMFRGYRVRKPFLVWRRLTLAAVVRIQALLRGRLGRKRWRRFWQAYVYRYVAKVQALHRGVVGRAYVRRVRFLRNTKMATRIQALIRGWFARLLHRRTRLQYRLWIETRRVGAVLNIQRVVRGFVARCRVLPRLYALRQYYWAVMSVQRVCRGFLSRRRVLHMCATRMERVARGYLARQLVRRLRAEMEAIEAARRRREEAFALAEGDKQVDITAERLDSKAGKAEIKAAVPAVKALRKQRKLERQGMTKAQVKVEEIRDTFEMFDVDGSGAIDEDEFKLLLNELCIPMTDSEIQAAVRSIDCDGNGTIEFPEFMDWFTAGEPTDEEAAADMEKSTGVKPKNLLQRMFTGGKESHDTLDTSSQNSGKQGFLARMLTGSDRTPNASGDVPTDKSSRSGFGTSMRKLFNRSASRDLAPVQEDGRPRTPSTTSDGKSETGTQAIPLPEGQPGFLRRVSSRASSIRSLFGRGGSGSVTSGTPRVGGGRHRLLQLGVIGRLGVRLAQMWRGPDAAAAAQAAVDETPMTHTLPAEVGATPMLHTDSKHDSGANSPSPAGTPASSSRPSSAASATGATRPLTVAGIPPGALAAADKAAAKSVRWLEVAKAEQAERARREMEKLAAERLAMKLEAEGKAAELAAREEELKRAAEAKTAELAAREQELQRAFAVREARLREEEAAVQARIQAEKAAADAITSKVRASQSAWLAEKSSVDKAEMIARQRRTSAVSQRELMPMKATFGLSVRDKVRSKQLEPEPSKVEALPNTTVQKVQLMETTLQGNARIGKLFRQAVSTVNAGSARNMLGMVDTSVPAPVPSSEEGLLPGVETDPQGVIDGPTSVGEDLLQKMRSMRTIKFLPPMASRTSGGEDAPVVAVPTQPEVPGQVADGGVEESKQPIVDVEPEQDGLAVAEPVLAVTDAIGEGTPDAPPEAAPEAAPEATPEAAPEAAPEATAETPAARNATVLALIRLKLKAQKLYKDLTGQTDRTLARRNLIAQARLDRIYEARYEFRRRYPPPVACDTCIRTFVFPSKLRRHKAAGCDHRKHW